MGNYCAHSQGQGLCSTCSQMLAQNYMSQQSMLGQQYALQGQLSQIGQGQQGLQQPSAPHVHEWVSQGSEMLCACGSRVSGRVKRDERPPENCIRCTDGEIELLRERFAEEIAENESLRSQNEALIASRNMLERGLADLRAELARTKDALAEAVMQRRGKR